MSDNKALTPDVIHAIIENQRRELTAKDKEFDLEKLKLQANQKSEERNLSFAQQQLEAIERDRKNAREYERTSETKGLIVNITLILTIAGFLITAVIMDKDNLVMEIIKFLMYGGSWGIGGYALGYKKRGEQNHDNQAEQI